MRLCMRMLKGWGRGSTWWWILFIREIKKKKRRREGKRNSWQKKMRESNEHQKLFRRNARPRSSLVEAHERRRRCMRATWPLGSQWCPTHARIRWVQLRRLVLKKGRYREVDSAWEKTSLYISMVSPPLPKLKPPGCCWPVPRENPVWVCWGASSSMSPPASSSSEKYFSMML
jgi:hypothetical protein